MEIIKNIFDIKNNWRKKKGIISALILLLVTWFGIEKFLFEKIEILTPNTIGFCYNKLVLIILLFGLFVYWLIDTCRLPIFNSSKINIFIVIGLDDEKCEPTVDGLIQNVLKEINSLNELRKIKIKLLPYNYFESIKSAENWANNFQNTTHTVIYFRFISGNVENSRKIDFNDVSFTGKLSNTLNPSGFGIDIKSELRFLLDGTNWEHLDKNSFHDNQKIQNNFREIFLFYSALSLVNENKLDNAIEIMRILYKKDDRRLKVEKFADRIELMIRKENLKAARFGALLYHISMAEIFKKMTTNNYEEILKLLNQIDELPCPRPSINHVNCVKAFTYYKCGQISNAISFTNKLAGDDNFHHIYLINSMFLSIVIDDFAGFQKAFKEIKPNTKIINVVEVLSFYSEEKVKYPDKIELLDFAETLLDIWYMEIPVVDKKTKVENLISKYDQSNSSYSKLYKHLSMVLKNVERKEVLLQKRKKKNAEHSVAK